MTAPQGAFHRAHVAKRDDAAPAPAYAEARENGRRAWHIFWASILAAPIPMR